MNGIRELIGTFQAQSMNRNILKKYAKFRMRESVSEVGLSKEYADLFIGFHRRYENSRSRAIIIKPVNDSRVFTYRRDET